GVGARLERFLAARGLTGADAVLVVEVRAAVDASERSVPAELREAVAQLGTLRRRRCAPDRRYRRAVDRRVRVTCRADEPDDRENETLVSYCRGSAEGGTRD